ncbi:hypothetical protein ES288_D04G028300v1 [Gossypium darwinii]|uniref:Uncharacterized protein n=1 Tax=Gossypium darwinii TaxID=34276 RepID=A0A5D2CWX3_GOSDA|nr:hypothetical protein ES288_D04G028300v1 [Gossypium darwinii]
MEDKTLNFLDVNKILHPMFLPLDGIPRAPRSNVSGDGFGLGVLHNDTQISSKIIRTLSCLSKLRSLYIFSMLGDCDVVTMTTLSNNSNLASRATSLTSIAIGCLRAPYTPTMVESSFFKASMTLFKAPIVEPCKTNS